MSRSSVPPAPYSQRDYANAMRAVTTPSALRELARGILQVAQTCEDPAEKLRAAEWLIVHTKGRPGTAAPAVDPLQLPRIQDAASALEAYQAVLTGVCTGAVCADSAKVYQSLIGDAAKIALADRAVNLLATGGHVELAVTDEEDLEAQLESMADVIRGAVTRMRSEVVTSEEPSPEAPKQSAGEG